MPTTNADLTPLELGRYLARVRERAGLKQAELARRVTWSPAVLSRVESGDRPLAPEELDQLLDGVGTPEASRLKVALARRWAVIDRPTPDHPDHELLWSAEEVGQQLDALASQPDVKRAFELRLAAYKNELRSAAGLLLRRQHQVAFIGSIGIGKSTAICRLTGLEVPVPDSPQRAPVLEAGAGGITICEVHLRSGPGYGILVEPCGEGEVRECVTEFAEYIRSVEAPSAEVGGDDDGHGISKEIERAIRNMAGLKVRREKSPDGKQLRRDDAKELAKQHDGVRELVVEVLSRMELPRRDRRDIWYDASTGKQPLEWLKDTFERINNGRHPEFALPRRIEVVVPTLRFDVDELSIRFIDTKGIDRPAARADLEVLLDDPHTLSVLCSGFNNAPAAEARLLLERAREAGVRHLSEKAALLVLPRPNEALAVKDESGQRVESVAEGYELKGEQVAMNLQSVGLEHLATGFFNAYQDDPTTLQEFLAGRLRAARAAFRGRLSEVVESARRLLANYEHEQTQTVMRNAASQLHTWIKQHGGIGSLDARVHDSLLSEMYRAHAATVRASVNRDGEWDKLSYGHQLGHGARRLAALSLSAATAGFSEICRNMAETPEYEEAREMITQADRLLQSAYEDLLQRVQLIGQTSFREVLKRDVAFWTKCRNEWGQGSGYKGRVATHSREWFDDPARTLEGELVTIIQNEWGNALGRIQALLPISS